MNIEWIWALAGGILIGIAVSLMLLFNGRVTGISGIIYGLMNPVRGDNAWRLYFIAGLFGGGLVLNLINPEAFHNTVSSSDAAVILAGLLVGFGTILGSGCTSGHGVCGLSRLSVRSVIATLTFIVSGILFVTLFKSLGVFS